jgi:general secretion pathway protein I
MRQRGFTLLEVMLAFVMLAAAMGVLISMLSNGLGQVSQAQRETEATLYAQSLIDQIGVLEPVVPERRTGEFDRGRYRYQLDVSEVDDPAPVPVPPDAVATRPVSAGPKVYRIALAVSWGTDKAGQRLQFVTLRARNKPQFGPQQ